jgi:hypothetical protein
MYYNERYATLAQGARELTKLVPDYKTLPKALRTVCEMKWLEIIEAHHAVLKTIDADEKAIYAEFPAKPSEANLADRVVLVDRVMAALDDIQKTWNIDAKLKEYYPAITLSGMRRVLETAPFRDAARHDKLVACNDRRQQASKEATAKFTALVEEVKKLIRAVARQEIAAVRVKVSADMLAGIDAI